MDMKNRFRLILNQEMHNTKMILENFSRNEVVEFKDAV